MVSDKNEMCAHIEDKVDMYDEFSLEEPMTYEKAVCSYVKI